MKIRNVAIGLALTGSTVVTALHPRSAKLEACPLLAKQYPPPTLSSESKFEDFAKAFDAELDKKVQKSTYKDTTFSIGIFAPSDEHLLYQYHHTGPAVANSSYGTKKVDADSIYRIGSISKLLTMYIFLLNEADKHWSDRITDHIPELLKYRANSWNDMTPDFSEITIGDLAGQMGGISRDFGLSDIAPKKSDPEPIPDYIRAAFPDIPSKQVPNCGWSFKNQSLVGCTIEEYLLGAANESPIFPTAYTPVYSNEGFAILGIVLQKITGTPIERLFNESLSKPLGLASTYFERPDEVSDHDVIPHNPDVSGWSTTFGPLSPAGGYLSSTNDFAKFGKDVLSNRFLSKSVTNRWLKPTSFVEDWSRGVGRPWEIFRLKVNGQSVDMYTKGGDWGAYHSFFGLLPDYNLGFTVLTAETLDSSLVRDYLPLELANAILPVLDQIAKDQTHANFAGRYTSTATNSSLTITTDGNDAGLKVTELISNGADIFGWYSSQISDLVWRLLPNQLNYGDCRIGFTTYQINAVPPSSIAPSLGNCQGWFDVDELVFGNIPVGQMVFTVDSSGKADAVDLRAFRATLKKES